MLPKKNNTPVASAHKAELRRLVLREIGPENARVFDAFAGDGEMYRGVWHEAARYVGCDRDFYRDEREMFACDTRRLMRCLDLTEFNVFDIDPHGAPWAAAIILAARRPVAPGETIGIVLTDGLELGVKLNVTDGAMRVLTGVTIRSGMARDYQRLHRMAIHALAGRMNARFVRHWMLNGPRGRGHANMRYSAVILRGAGDGPVAEADACAGAESPS